MQRDGAAPVAAPLPDFSTLRFTDHPANPLIAPHWPRWLVADPAVLLPGETPDGRWHLFANTLPPKLVEYVSDDGLRWERLRSLCPGALRPWLRRLGDRYWLFSEDVTRWLPLRSRIVVRTSADLVEWTPPRPVLEPSLPWHGRRARTCSNPCVVPWRGEWLLFYSAGVVWLRDCGFVEPRHVGVARAPAPEGPWRPDPAPLVSPCADDPWRNLGAGSLKAVPDETRGVLWGLTNGIYRDAEGRSGSAIRVVRIGETARSWEPAPEAPILAPEPGWKRALVYALDVRLREQRGTPELWLYYNARDGWLFGTERIGLAIGRRR